MRRNKKGPFASGLEKWAFDILDKADVGVRYEPTTFTYKKRTQRTYCNDCGSKSTHKLARYTPDFRIGRTLYVETKGRFTSANRTAMEDFLACTPGFDLRFVFGADNYLTARKLKRYSDWAVDLGVTYAIKEIPNEWIDDARLQLADRRESL